MNWASANAHEISWPLGGSKRTVRAIQRDALGRHRREETEGVAPLEAAEQPRKVGEAPRNDRAALLAADVVEAELAEPLAGQLGIELDRHDLAIPLQRRRPDRRLRVLRLAAETAGAAGREVGAGIVRLRQLVRSADLRRGRGAATGPGIRRRDAVQRDLARPIADARQRRLRRARLARDDGLDGAFCGHERRTDERERTLTLLRQRRQR